MRVAGRLPSEVFEEEEVLGERTEPLLAADHHVDVHQMVIHHVRQVVGGKAVALQEHLVVHGVPLELDVSAYLVLEGDGPFVRDLHADHVRLAGFHPLLRFFRSQLEAHAVVHRRLVARLLRFAHLFQALCRAEATVRMTRFKQRLRVLSVQTLRLPLRLDVRSLGPFLYGSVSPEQHALIRLHPRPRQRLEDVLHGTGDGARLVGVFDAQEELPLGLPREQEAHERGAESSHMEEACG